MVDDVFQNISISDKTESSEDNHDGNLMFDVGNDRYDTVVQIIVEF